MSEEAKGATSGALQGAAAGASVGAFGGPVGMGIGAAVGAVVGGAWGSIGGRHGDKAKKYMRKARKIQQQREAEAYRQSLLSELRKGRIQRASNLAAAVAAGIEEGSASQANLSSIGSQISNVVEYMSVDRGRAVQYAEYMAKAKKQANKAKDTMSALSTTATVVGAIGMVGSGIAAASSTASAEAAGQVAVTQAGVEAGQQSAHVAAYQASQAGLQTGLSSAQYAALSQQYASQAALAQNTYNYSRLFTSSIGVGRGIYSGTSL